MNTPKITFPNWNVPSEWQEVDPEILNTIYGIGCIALDLEKERIGISSLTDEQDKALAITLEGFFDWLTYIGLSAPKSIEAGKSLLTMWYLAERPLANDEDRKRHLHTMPYKQYLETVEWNIKRKEKLKSAGYRCELCYGKGQLHTHHKTYIRRGYESNNDLIVLCAKCHAKVHDKLPKE